MAPILAQIGSVFVYTYGVFLMLGFLWACFLLWKHIRISKFPEDQSFDIAFISFAGSLIVGRIVYGLLNFEEFGLSIMRYILVNGYPGISVIGMIVGWFGTMYVICARNKLRFDEYVDYSTPSVFMFVTVAAVGSFFAGTEPGIRWGWYQHPLGLYRAIFGGFGLYMSIRLLFIIRKELLNKGFSAVFFVWLYSLSHVLLQPLKDARVLLTEVKGEYYVYAILLLTSSFYIVYYFRVFLMSLVGSFINWNAHYVKTAFKGLSRKTKKSDRGGAEEDNSTDRKS